MVAIVPKVRTGVAAMVVVATVDEEAVVAGIVVIVPRVVLGPATGTVVEAPMMTWPRVCGRETRAASKPKLAMLDRMIILRKRFTYEGRCQAISAFRVHFGHRASPKSQHSHAPLIRAGC